jgi:hypothetical protein
MTFCADLNSLPNCCGIYEAGSFEREYSDEYREYEEDTPEELVHELLDSAGGRPLVFNFVRHRRFDGTYNEEFQVPELRDFVMKHPNASNIHTWINPSGGNEIDCWIIKGYKEIVYDPD